MESSYIAKEKQNRRRAFNILCLLIFAVGMGIYMIVMPKYGDDVRFVEILRHWFNNQEIKYFTYGGNPFVAGVPWDEISHSWQSLYNGDNARLSNVFAMLFVILPKWIGSTLCWVCLLYTLRVEAQILGIKLEKSFLTPLFVSGWVLCMQWSNHMGGLVFQFNYVIPGMLSFMLLRELYDIKNRRIWVTALLALILGVFHEGFSIPFISGLVVVLVLFRNKRDKKIFVALAGLIVGLLWILLAPSLGAKVNGTFPYSYIAGWSMAMMRFAKVFICHPVIWLFIAILFVGIIRKWNGINLRSPIIVFMLTSVLTCIPLAYFTTGEPRVAWFGDMISVYGIIYIFKHHLSKASSKFIISLRVLNLVMAAGMLLVLVITDYCVIKTEKEFRKVISEFLVHPDRPVYNDWLASYERKPWVNLSIFEKGSNEFETIAYPSLKDDDYRDNPMKGKIYFLPEILRSYSVEESVRIPGEGKVRNFHGHLVIEADQELEKMAEGLIVPMDFGWGVKPDTGVILIPFVSEKDGKRYFFVRIYHRQFEHLVGNLKYVGRFPRE